MLEGSVWRILAGEDGNQPFRNVHLTTLEHSLAPPSLTDGRQAEKRAYVPEKRLEGEYMKRSVLLLAVFLAAVTVLHAQNQGKPSYATNMLDGTILPVQLSSTISLDRAVPGQPISARIAQDVPLENGAVLRRGTKVLGHIVSVTPGNPSRIAFAFDRIEYSKSNTVSVATNLRALASTLDISGASLPNTGPDRGTPSVWWNTVQVGGEGLYGSGPLTHGDQVVGHWVWGGAVGQVAENGACRGAVAGNATSNWTRSDRLPSETTLAETAGADTIRSVTDSRYLPRRVSRKVRPRGPKAGSSCVNSGSFGLGGNGWNCTAPVDSSNRSSRPSYRPRANWA